MEARIVAVVTNIPGPIAAARLAGLGAHVVKVEPEQGDPLAAAAPQWYEDLTRSVRVVRLNLKDDSGRACLHELLAQADLLITAMRSGALARLGLTWNEVRARFPDLCHVAIFGESTPNEDRAGHDLTYQARAGLVTPPAMPRTVYADLFAAERTVSEAISVLYERDRTGIPARHDVAIGDCAAALADPVRYGLTSKGAPLSGAFPDYALYRTRDGWIALAALEAHFRKRLLDALHIETLDGATLQARFAQHPSEYWEALAAAHDLPLASVREAS